MKPIKFKPQNYFFGLCLISISFLLLTNSRLSENASHELYRLNGATATYEFLISNGMQEEDGRTSYGADSAPIQIVLFTDFECPYCAQAHAVLEETARAYPDQIRILLKHFPLPFHERAKPAALAALAAARQNKYWAYSNRLFASQNQLEAEKLVGHAAALGLDTLQFVRDLADPQLLERLDRDMAGARQLRIEGTPSLFINGERWFSEITTAGLKSIIEEILNENALQTLSASAQVRSLLQQAQRVFVKNPFHTLSHPENTTQNRKLSETAKLKTVPNCSADKLREVRERATSSKSAVGINCNLTLRSSDVITKRLVLSGAAATGVTINCNGAHLSGLKGVTYNKDMIEIKSRRYEEGGLVQWERPENININNCRITGALRIWGMGRNGEAPDVRASSRKAGHTRRARNNAPRNIVFNKITITGTGRNPFYLAPGVSYTQLINSEIKGKSIRVGVYMDAESYKNTIKDSYIHVETQNERFRPDWPQIALDGSSNNTIINNRFAGLNHGGIYFYRNCGEGGTVRHATPSRNKIINNIFYYNKYKGDNPAIYVGSRNGGFFRTFPRLGYCDDDRGYPFGSSKDDRDFARYNVIAQNRIYKRSIRDMIKSEDWSVNSRNYIRHNQTVSSASKRPAGCYVSRGYHTQFIFHGQSIDLFKNSKGEPVCYGYKLHCNNGELNRVSSSSCRVSKVNFSCKRSNSNAGCKRTVSCPAGQRVVAAKAACNLEYGEVSVSVAAGVATNNIKVVKASDKVSDGSCYVGENSARSGQKAIRNLNRSNSVAVGCKEKDKNGGDCHIRGVVYCN